MKIKSIPLTVPITVDGQEIKEIRLRKPSVGELRGLKLIDVLQMDVEAVTKLASRIAEPNMSEEDISAFDLSDFTLVATETVGFFTGSGGAFPAK